MLRAGPGLGSEPGRLPVAATTHTALVSCCLAQSTMFNALCENAKAQAANFPFCTIEPNVGIVAVPDSRLAVLSKLSNSGGRGTAHVPGTILTLFVGVSGQARPGAPREGS